MIAPRRPATPRAAGPDPARRPLPFGRGRPGARRLPATLGLVAALVGALAGLPASSAAPSGQAPREYSRSFGVVGGPMTKTDMERLRTRWFFNYAPTNPGLAAADRDGPDGFHFVPLFGVGAAYPGDEAARASVTAAVAEMKLPDRYPAPPSLGPGPRFYILGNEPNLRADGDSDTTDPAVYAKRFWVYCDQIRREDPSGKIVGPGIAYWRWRPALDHPTGRAWFDQLVSAYKNLPPVADTPCPVGNGAVPPIDVLNIHLYYPAVLNKENLPPPAGTHPSVGEALDWFRADLADLRAYAETGYRQKAYDPNVPTAAINDPYQVANGGAYPGVPIWITEFGAVHCTVDVSPCFNTNALPVLSYMAPLLHGAISLFEQQRAALNIGKWFVFISFAENPAKLYPIKLFATANPGLSESLAPPVDGAQPLSVYGEIFRRLSNRFSEAPLVSPASAPVYDTAPVATINTSTGARTGTVGTPLNFVATVVSIEGAARPVQFQWSRQGTGGPWTEVLAPVSRYREATGAAIFEAPIVFDEPGDYLVFVNAQDSAGTRCGGNNTLPERQLASSTLLPCGISAMMRVTIE